MGQKELRLVDIKRQTQRTLLRIATQSLQLEQAIKQGNRHDEMEAAETLSRHMETLIELEVIPIRAELMIPY